MKYIRNEEKTITNDKRSSNKISKRLRTFFLQHGLALGIASMGVTGISGLTGCSRNDNNDEDGYVTIAKITENGIDINGIDIYEDASGEKKVGTLSQDQLILLDDTASIDRDKLYEATIFDENMDKQDGYVKGMYLEALTTLNSQEVEKYDTIYKATGDVYLRDEETYEQKTVINEGNFVLGSSETITGTEKDIINLSGVNLTKVLSFDGDGNLNSGIAASNYLEKVISLEDLTEVNDLEERIVDTSEDNVDTLNLRESPSVYGNITGLIPTGTTVYLQDSKTQSVDGYTWQEVIYYNTETKEYESGWVANKFLKEIEKDELEYTRGNDLTNTYNGKSITVSSDTNVIGIDIWKMSIDDLANFAASGLENDYIYTDGNGYKYHQNMSSYYENSWYDDATTENAKLDFVIIKMGASEYGIGPLKINESDYYINQIKFCEANNIPYGLYYYSTCLNEEEATKEATFIKNAYQELLDNGTIKDYNLLPFAIDVEIGDGKERQSAEWYQDYDKSKYSSSVEAVTDAKVTLANLLEADNELGNSMGKTILYTSGGASYNNSTKLIDISDYNQGVKSGDSDIWFVRTDAISSKNTHEKDENGITEEEGANVTIRQIAIDGEYTTISGNLDYIDIDVMSSETFKEYINGEYQKLASSKTIDTPIKIAQAKEIDDNER